MGVNSINNVSMCRFSVITIAYNSEKTIERTLKSVLAQTYKDYEYLVIDGKSTDGTLGVIKNYEPLFEGKLKWVSEPDSGIYDAMNKGIKMSSGDIIGIVNSDDWLEKDALANVYKGYLENKLSNRALYCGGINFHFRNGDIKQWNVNLASFKLQAHLYIMAGIRHPAVFVPQEVYKEIGIFNDQMHLSADQDFILRCYYGGMSFVDLKCIISNMSEGGLSTEGTERSKRISEEDRRIMLKQFGKKGFSYYWLWYSWKLRNCLKNLVK